MVQQNDLYKETIERYCHVIGKNTTFSRYTRGEEQCYECSNRHECEKNGGCSHHIFSAHNTTKKEG